MNTSILFSIDIETSNKEVLAIIAIKTNRVKIDKHQLPFECRKGKLASLLKDLAKSHIEYTQQYKKKVSPYSGWLIPLKKAYACMQAIAALGCLAFKGKKLIVNFFSPVELIYEVSSHDLDHVKITSHISWKNNQKNLFELDAILMSRPPIFIYEGILRSFSKDFSLQWLKQPLIENPWILTQQQWINLKEDINLLKEEGDPTPILIEEVKKIVSPSPNPILELTTPSGIFAKLWMDYGNSGKVLINGCQHSSIPRNYTEENLWKEELLAAGYQEKSPYDPTFICSSEHSLDAIEQLLQEGWTLLDNQQREIVLQTNHDLKINLNNNHLTLQGSISFEKINLPPQVLTQVMPSRPFIPLSDHTVGLLTGVFVKALPFHTLKSAQVTQNTLSFPICDMSMITARSTLFEYSSSAQALRKQLCTLETLPTLKPSPSFKGTLRHYQEQGVQWIYFLYQRQWGGILADDMGLGKTVQVIAFFSLVKKKNGPHLIIVPSSLIFQWSNEIKKFFTSASVYRYHGKQRKEQELSNFDIIISSYRTVQLDIHLLEALTFHTLILDEAHKIKNPSSQTFKAIISLKAHFKLSLTGTPIENALHEIWAQFHCLMPKLLAPYSEIKGQLQSQDPTFMTSLKQKIKPFILRRSKKEVAPELPDKIEQITWIEMSEDESILYQNFLSQAQDILQECVEKPSIQILEAILRLRQFCCHPLLVSSLLEQEPNFMPEKFSLVLEDVQNIYLEGYKIILCSQFTSCLSLLAQALCKQGIPNLSLTGKTQDKASIVDEFQNTPTPSVMLMSLKAGGVGLNLTAADYVLLYDPWWNDAVENQAIDRAHRIGRKHTVFAKRYLYNNSIEEKMLSLKKQKSLLSNNFMEGTHKALCKEDFEFLLEAF